MTKILLASEGRAFSRAAIVKVAELAGADGEVHVLSIARIWGVALGFPNPWLLPSKQEWAEQRDRVASAVMALKGMGRAATGSVIGARNAAKRINKEAVRLGCDAIVMGADARKSRFAIGLIWSQEPYRIQKKARLPVHLVVV